MANATESAAGVDEHDIALLRMNGTIVAVLNMNVRAGRARFGQLLPQLLPVPVVGQHALRLPRAEVAADLTGRGGLASDVTGGGWARPHPTTGYQGRSTIRVIVGSIPAARSEIRLHRRFQKC